IKVWRVGDLCHARGVAIAAPSPGKGKRQPRRLELGSRLVGRNGLSNAERAESCRILHRSPKFACIRFPTQATHRVFALAQIDLAVTKGVFLVPASVVARNTVSRDDIAFATCPTIKGRP